MAEVTSGETIRPLREADLERLEELSGQVGFNQTRADWERLLRLAPDGCFAATRGGRVVATTTTTAYAGRLAWVGMVVVDESFRRLGIGSRLVEHALNHLDSAHGIRNVALDATVLGKQVYDRYGFVEQYQVHRLQGEASAVDATTLVGVRPMSPTDLPAVTAMESAALGVPRATLLEDLCRAFPEGCSVVEDEGRLIAWSFRRPGARRWHIGPVGARDQRAADLAFQAAISPIPGAPIELDVPEGPRRAHLAKRFALTTARSFARMVRGPSLPDPDGGSGYATVAPELG